MLRESQASGKLWKYKKEFGWAADFSPYVLTFRTLKCYCAHLQLVYFCLFVDGVLQRSVFGPASLANVTPHGANEASQHSGKHELMEGI